MKNFFLVIPTRDRIGFLSNLLLDLNAFASYISQVVIVDQSIEDYTINVDVALAPVNTNKNTVALYPNDFCDVLKISDVKGVKSVSITDVAGRLVKTMKPAAELNVSELKAGLYIVTINMEDGSSKTIKAIKK